MKFLSVILLAVCALVSAEQTFDLEEFGIADQIRDAIENIKKQMPCGFPDQGIPPLAPFEHEFEEVNVDNELLTILANVSKLFAIGADNFDIKRCDFKLLTQTLHLELNFNDFHIQRGNYFLEALMMAGNRDLKVHGLGDLDFALKHLNIKVEAKFGIIGGISLKKFHCSLELGDVKSKITGLMGGGLTSEIINSVLEEVILTTVTDHKDEISEKIKEIAVPIIEKILKEMKYNEVFDNIMTKKPLYISNC